ncbi:hypothetical protein L7F22_007552 [Adiantum nelumboides]|nr:hypothetical protein [Adiantum nelumboides]
MPQPTADVPPLPHDGVKQATNAISCEDKGEEKIMEAEAMRGKQATIAEEPRQMATNDGANKKEKKKKKKASMMRRKIGIINFPVKSRPQDLIEEVQRQEPKLTWPQLLHLFPRMWRQWSNMVSKRRCKNVNTLKAQVLEDDVLVLDILIKGQRVSREYVDEGAQMCVISEKRMHKLGLEVSGSSGFKADNVFVKYVGVVTVCGIQVGVDITFLLKPPRKEGKSIQTTVHNVNEGRKECSELETLEDEWSTKDSSSTAEVTSSVTDSESEKANLLEAMGVVLTRPTTQDGGSIKETLSDEKIEDMLSTDLSKEERKEKATGKAGGGLVLHYSNGEVVMKKHVKLLDSTSNNEAKYGILLHGLQVCVSQKIRRLMVKGDALLIVKQILGIWACKNERLREKVQAIRRLFNQFEEVQLYHIPRKQNEVVDLLAQKAVVCDESEVQVILAASAIKQPRYQGMESLAPIVSYILEGEFPQSFTKAQKQRLMEKASSYLFLEGALYQRGKDQVCRRIPTVEEIPSILEGLHEEACGGHFAQELTAKKILLSGYVWPSLHIDVQHWCKSCHNCQVNGNKHLLHGPRQLVLANGPFEKWGIDAMGPLPRTKNGKLYILVAIDYMTKWVEAQSVTRVNEKTVSRFVYTHICCRFGTPLEIVFDNGPGFRKGLLTEVCEELHILHRHSTPYYPQSNGLVEKANGIIVGIIRKMVKNKTKLWDDFLDGALWAYRTTYKEATEFTPFHLVYGQEALQPIELNIPTMRLHGKAAQRKEEEWTDRLLTLAELESKREVAYECYKRKATQVKDKLDKEVKDKGIKEGDLVLRYDNRFDAKFETRWQGPYIVKKAFNSSYYQLMDID